MSPRADDVCYSVRKFDGYGKLSGKSLEDLRAGERVDVMAGKQDPLDFVLWKHARDDEPAEVKWESPWGTGRPGWHIECSAMGSQLLGKHFDIHGGGQDLQFPHHENEIAQSEGAHRCQFVNYWMHNGFVRVDDEKMSKSLGNFFTIREVLKKYDPEVVRFFILRAHYRSPLNYSDVHLDDARQALTRLYTALKGVAGAVQVDWNEAHAVRFKAALDDDFGTPEAMAVLFDLADAVNRGEAALAGQLKGLGRRAGPAAARSADLPAGGAGRRPAATKRSTQKSAPAARRRRRRTSPSPTASVTNSRPPASCSRTGRRGQPGVEPDWSHHRVASADFLGDGACGRISRRRSP